MSEAIIEFFRGFIGNDYLLLFVISLFPLVEMRGAVILAASMNVNPFLAFLVCGSGSAIVCLPLIFLLKPIFNQLKKFKLFYKLIVFFENLFADKADMVRKTASHKYNNKVFWALASFVAVPLPLTGVWTGSGIAVFLEMPVSKAAAAIIGGNFAAAGILSLIMVFAKPYTDYIMIGFAVLILLSIAVPMILKLIKKRRRAAEITPSQSPDVSMPEQKDAAENEREAEAEHEEINL